MKREKQQTAMKREKQQKAVVQRKKTEDHKKRRRLGGLINQRRPPLSAGGGGVYSPQNSPQPSSSIDLKGLLAPSSSSKSSKSAKAAMSASMLTPLTPSSKPADFAKSRENGKFLPNSVDTPFKDTSQNLIAASPYQGAINSCVHTESAEKQSSCDEKVDPVKRLVDAVASMSSRALSSAIQDISAVMNLTDRMAANFLHDDSTKIIFHDLADDISKLRMQSLTKDGMEIETRFCGRANANKLKKEPSDVLFEEIKEINRRFLEVKVDVISRDDVSRRGFDEGILIHCSYVPVGPASQYMIHKLLLELIVPADYPTFSPTVSENMSRGCGDSEEGKYLWTKAKLNFGKKLGSFSQPITVKQMARAWEASAQDVFVEYAQQMGGGSFSSRYYGIKMGGSSYSLCC